MYRNIVILKSLSLRKKKKICVWFLCLCETVAMMCCRVSHRVALVFYCLIFLSYTVSVFGCEHCFQILLGSYLIYLYFKSKRGLITSKLSVCLSWLFSVISLTCVILC